MNWIQNRGEFRKILDDFRGIGIDISMNVELDEEMLMDFKDGTLLCKIIGVLEGKTLDNVTLNPKSQASCLHNIWKALHSLKRFKSIPVHLLYSE